MSGEDGPTPTEPPDSQPARPEAKNALGQQSRGLSFAERLEVILAEYGRLQEHAEHVRQARDTRVNWYTAIIAGAVAAAGVLLDRGLLDNAPSDAVSWAVVIGFAFVLILGFHAFEAAQRYNISAIACQIQTARVRRWLAELEPEFETRLGWKTVPELGHRRSLWIPTMTLTINALVALAAAATALIRSGVSSSWSAVGAMVTALLFVASHVAFARRRYHRLLAELGESATSATR